jgi:hypothetical protein
VRDSSTLYWQPKFALAVTSWLQFLHLAIFHASPDKCAPVQGAAPARPRRTAYFGALELIITHCGESIFCRLPRLGSTVRIRSPAPVLSMNRYLPAVRGRRALPSCRVSGRAGGACRSAARWRCANARKIGCARHGMRIPAHMLPWPHLCVIHRKRLRRR